MDDSDLYISDEEPQTPKNLQNLFILAKSYQVTLFLNLGALSQRGGGAEGRGGCTSGSIYL